MGTQHTIDHDLLVAQTGWVESLAKNLVRDPSGAEDVAQETLLAALKAPPRDAADAKRLRAWLGKVAFNLAHLATRRNSRRRSREERAAQQEELSSTADRVVRASLLQRVIEAVMELDEPYRTTVYLRYFNGMSTADIAVHTETSDNAVRKRLWRAREKLRGVLDAEHNGDRYAWFSALAPLAFPNGFAEPAATSTAAATSTSAKSFAATPLLVAGSALGLALLVGLGRTAERNALDTPQLDNTNEVARTEPLPLGRRALEREAVELAPATLPPPQPPEIETEPETESVPPTQDDEVEAVLSVSGRVLDLRRTPLSGLDIVAADAPDAVLARSADDGTFTVPVSTVPTRLEARGEGYAALRSSIVDELQLDAEHVLVVAPAVNASGWVVDEGDTPLDDARVEVVAPASVFVHLREPLDRTAAIESSTQSDANGAFTLANAVTGESFLLRVSREGYQTVEIAMPRADDASLWIRLQELPAPPSWLHGFVFHESDEPAVEAEVRFGDAVAMTASDGSFSLPVGDFGPATPLVADKDGFEPAEIPGFGAMIATGDDHLAFGLQLQLGSSMRAISGEVVDERGRPVSGWRVAALSVPEEGGTRAAANAPDPGKSSMTGGDGSFSIGQLTSAQYVILAYDPPTMRSVRSGIVRAGQTDLSLTVGSAATPTASVQGRILTSFGEPLAGADVSVSFDVENEDDLAMHGANDDEEGSDTFGFFTMDGVPDDGVWMSVRHERLRAASVRMDPNKEQAEWIVEEDRFLYLEDARADAFSVLDADGEELLLHALDTPVRRAPLFGGVSLVQRVSGAAHTVVLLKDGVEIERIELDAPTEAGEITPVRAQR